MHTAENLSGEHTLLPGIKPVAEMLAAAPERVDHVYCQKNARSPGMFEIQRLCHENGIRFSLVEESVLARLCRHPSGKNRLVRHQGVVARLAASAYAPLQELIDSMQKAPLPILIALDQVQDPGNLGAIARTLYALGGAGLLLPQHNSALLGPAALRSSAGALERLPVARVTNLGRALDRCEEAGLNIYGATTAPGAANVFVCPPQLPGVLVLGNEARGLRPGIVKRCGSILSIPLARHFDSLNVAQAGAIFLGLAAAAHRYEKEAQPGETKKE